MISKGVVVEIKRDNKSQVAMCIDCKTNKVRLVLGGNKEVSVPIEKIFFPSEYTLDLKLPREELLRTLKEIHDNRDVLKASIPLEELWQLLIEEGGNYTPSDIAELNFGKDFTSDQLAAVFRALNEDIIFFKSKKTEFYPNSPEHVEQIQQMLRVEREKNERNQKIVRWIKNIWQGEKPDTNSDVDAFIAKLKYVAVQKIESRTHKIVNDLLKEADLSGPNVPFRLLVKASVWDEDENLELYEHEIPVKFAREILQEAQAIVSRCILQTEGKLDLSHIHTFTIDNEDTRDMDDALSIEENETGYRVGIHITDVAEYIFPDTCIDIDARARYTSIYFPEQKISMFPEILSNELCSLLREKLRPAISVIVDFDKSFNIRDYQIKETIIKVKERFTYEEVDDLIEKVSDFSSLYTIAEKLRERRKTGGAKFFYVPELEIKVNENKEISFKVYERESPAHNLVSEMMIIANELCARYCKENSIPIIYRSQPDLDEHFNPPDGYNLLSFFQQRKYLKKSEASTYPQYHYGLGVEFYTQMTSPIRRYSDLIIHRQLKNFLHKGTSFYNKEKLDEIIMVSERILEVANLITRHRKRYWLLKYLKKMIGQTVRAVVLQNLTDRLIIILKDTLLELTCMASQPFSPGEEINVRIETVLPREDIIKVSVI